MRRRRTDLELVELHRRTSFVFDERGRMTHEAAPDRPRGPRFRLEGCLAGNVTVIRDDVPDDVATALERLASEEPPLVDPDVEAVHLASYLELLAPTSHPAHEVELSFVFPDRLASPVDAPLVRSGTDAGDDLVACFHEVLHPSLAGIGFRTSTDLWSPWCAAVVDGQVVSLAETVRRGPGGAEVGVDTATGHRGRGLGAAVTAGWARHPELGGSTLFYGTSRSNTSSRRLAARLALPVLGCSSDVF